MDFTSVLLPLLNKLPFNGYKRYIGIVGLIIVVGSQSVGLLNPQIAEVLTSILVAWTGVAVMHNDMKASAGV